MSLVSLDTLYRPVGEAEPDLIRAAAFAAFPPRLARRPIFYPVRVERYAVQIARDWNTRDGASGFVGYVTRFRVPTEFLARYPVQRVGDADAFEHWIAAEELAEFNRQIVGLVEVIHTFGSPSPQR